MEAAVVNGTSTFKICGSISSQTADDYDSNSSGRYGYHDAGTCISFLLGFGAVAPTPEWGLMLNEGRTYMAKAPWLMIAPGIAIVIVVIIF